MFRAFGITSRFLEEIKCSILLSFLWSVFKTFVICLLVLGGGGRGSWFCLQTMAFDCSLCSFASFKTFFVKMKPIWFLGTYLVHTKGHFRNFSSSHSWHCHSFFQTKRVQILYILNRQLVLQLVIIKQSYWLTCFCIFKEKNPHRTRTNSFQRSLNSLPDILKMSCRSITHIKESACMSYTSVWIRFTE